MQSLLDRIASRRNKGSSGPDEADSDLEELLRLARQLLGDDSIAHKRFQEISNQNSGLIDKILKRQRKRRG